MFNCNRVGPLRSRGKVEATNYHDVTTVRLNLATALKNDIEELYCTRQKMQLSTLANNNHTCPLPFTDSVSQSFLLKMEMVSSLELCTRIYPYVRIGYICKNK